MDTRERKLVFISYRRSDAGFAAQYVANGLQVRYGPDSVFIDTDQIQGGDYLRIRIETALAEAAVVIALIGKSWLRVQDSDGRRRLDVEDDWVRFELAYALNHQLPLIPLLVSGSDLPLAPQLPTELKRLPECKAMRMDEETSRANLDALIAIIDKKILVRRQITAEPNTYPLPVDVYNQPLTEVELADRLGSIPEWRIVRRPLPEGGSELRTELYRVYRFASYTDVVHFMVTSSRFIAKSEHHPDWENVYQSLRVWLTSWDIGHKPSEKDIKLATYLDSLYESYKPR